MASSSQARIYPLSFQAPYTANGTINAGCAVSYPDADGLVVADASGFFMGIAANSVVLGEEVIVVGFGLADALLAGTVTWGTTPFLKPTTDGKFVAAAANETSLVRAFPDAREGLSGAANDLIRVVIGVGAFHV